MLIIDVWYIYFQKLPGDIMSPLSNFVQRTKSKMAATEMPKSTLSHIFQTRWDTDMCNMSFFMFSGTRNPMAPSLSLYNAEKMRYLLYNDKTRQTFHRRDCTFTHKRKQLIFLGVTMQCHSIYWDCNWFHHKYHYLFTYLKHSPHISLIMTYLTFKIFTCVKFTFMFSYGFSKHVGSIWFLFSKHLQ